MRMKQTAGAQKELNVEFLPLDLASFQSTKEFVRLFKEKNLPLHILINNAAVAWVPFSTCVCVCVMVILQYDATVGCISLYCIVF